MIGAQLERASKVKALVTGLSLAVTMAAFVLLAAGPAHAATFTVNLTGDAPDANLANAVCDVNASAAGNQCTFRAAIQEANDNPGADIINFNISGTGVKTISPASELPVVSRPVTIDAYTQRGAKPNSLAVGNNAALRIQLSGTGVPGGTGLRIGGPNTTVKGLVINRWANGVRIGDSNAIGNKITGNFIGTNASGTQDLGNGDNGVDISDAPNNTIGGPTPGTRNVISGNEAFGISIANAGATGNKVIGNYVGTDRNGTTDLGNSGDGVFIHDNAANNTVGGTTSGTRNLISGNNGHGISVAGADATGNKIMGNRIGTDASGILELGNISSGVNISAPDNVIGGLVTQQSNPRNLISGNGFRGVTIDGAVATGNKIMGNRIGTDASGTRTLGNAFGVVIDGAPENTVGGTTAGARNLISGNEGSGVIISGADAMGNRVIGNFIGTAASGTGSLGNLHGVAIGDAAFNAIGGEVTDTSNPGNIISGNNAQGVFITGNTATNNFILSNSIYANGGLGINLGSDGVTPNDAGDVDAGPNRLQNFPVLTSAKTSVDNTTIKGTLNGTANTGYTLQFFGSPTADPSGNGEGKTFRFERNVVTDGGGDASFTFTTSKKVPKGQVVTATAINQSLDGFGDTSEFSNAVTVT